jgi:hypothetical protein
VRCRWDDTVIALIAASVVLVLLTLAAIHVYWAVRRVGTNAGVPSRADGQPVFRPGRVATLAVAVALITAALLVAGRAQLLALHALPVVLRIGTWGVATAFALRTIGEFRYVGLFKRVHGTPFARWDTVLFTPLCAAIAIATAVVARS